VTTPPNQLLMWALGLSAGALLIAGCETKPERLDLPAYEATAGPAAVAVYDTNKDGKISGNELVSSPAHPSSRSGVTPNTI